MKTIKVISNCNYHGIEDIVIYHKKYYRIADIPDDTTLYLEPITGWDKIIVHIQILFNKVKRYYLKNISSIWRVR